MEQQPTICLRCKKKIRKGCVIVVYELPTKPNLTSTFSLCQNCRIIVGSLMKLAFMRWQDYENPLIRQDKGAK